MRHAAKPGNAEGDLLEHPAEAELWLALDDELCPNSAGSLKRHIAVCSSCRSRAHEIERWLSMRLIMSEPASALPNVTPRAERNPDGPWPYWASEAKEQVPGIAFARTMKGVRRKLRDLYEHRPHNLTIVADGAVIAEQKVLCNLRRQKGEIELRNLPEFVEIFGERGICLLAMYVDISAPCDAAELQQEARLSLGRRIEALLRLEKPLPILEVSYDDPLLPEMSS